MMKVVRDAQEKESARASREAAKNRERVERAGRRLEAINHCLAGFDHEIDWDDQDCFFVALRHPHRASTWLAFAVDAFSSDDQPLLPLEAREIQIYAGRITERTASLGLAAAEYVMVGEG